MSTKPELLNKVENWEFSIKEKQYRYVRTEGGDYYEEFRDQNFVGVGYNYIRKEEISEPNLGSMKEKVILHLSKNIENPFPLLPFSQLSGPEKSKVTKITNHLLTLKGLNLGDIVIAPNKHSNQFCIGKIDDEDLYNPSDEEFDECPYQLRRKVQWILTDYEIPSYSPIMFSLKHTWETMSDLSKHADYINGLFNPFFSIDNKVYFNLNIRRNTDIPLKDLKDLLDGIYQTAEILNEMYGFGESIDQTSIRLSLNSPGHANIIQNIDNSTKGLAIAATLLLFGIVSSCGSDNEIMERTGATQSEAQKLKIQQDSIKRASNVLGVRIPTEIYNP